MKRQEEIFRTKDLDLITFLRFQGYATRGNPIEDVSGTRWVLFTETAKLRQDVYSFLSGNKEACLLQEFRRSRSYLLDTEPRKMEKENGNNAHTTKD